jgi:hypothetical protein
MPENTLNLDAVPTEVRPTAELYASLVGRLAGDNLLGLTLFGVSLTDEFDPKTASISSVVVLGRVELSFLRRLADEGLKLGKNRVAAPLIMTPEYIADSLDSFPLELIEIHQMRATVLGEDHFADIDPQPEHVRLQCEREFKRILVRLRQGLLAAAGRQNVLVELLADIGQHVRRTLSGLLWLVGMREFKSGTEALSEVERISGKRFDGVRHVLRVGLPPETGTLDRLYAEIEVLARIANDF